MIFASCYIPPWSKQSFISLSQNIYKMLIQLNSPECVALKTLLLHLSKILIQAGLSLFFALHSFFCCNNDLLGASVVVLNVVVDDGVVAVVVEVVFWGASILILSKSTFWQILHLLCILLKSEEPLHLLQSGRHTFWQKLVCFWRNLITLHFLHLSSCLTDFWRIDANLSRVALDFEALVRDLFNFLFRFFLDFLGTFSTSFYNWKQFVKIKSEWWQSKSILFRARQQENSIIFMNFIFMELNIEIFLKK